MSHKIEFQKNWVTYDDSYDYFHLLRNDYVIQKQLRNYYVNVWTTHMSHKIELKKNWVTNDDSYEYFHLLHNDNRLVIWLKTNWYK